jgi:hypothetical protein
VSSDGTASHSSGDICIRYDQTDSASKGFDSAKLKGGYTTDDAVAINDSRDNFEFVTYSFNFYDRALDSATITNGTTTIEVTPQTNISCNTLWGLMLGNKVNSDDPAVDVVIKEITVIAGEPTDYTSLVWPGEEGAIVKDTPASVLKTSTTESTEKNTAKETEQVTEPATTAPVENQTEAATNVKTEETTATTQTTKKGGCQSSLPSVAGIACLTLLAVPLFRKKRRD